MRSRRPRILPVLLTPLALLLAGCGGPTLVERIQFGWGTGLCGTVIIVLDIIAIIEVAGSERTLGSKVLWVLLIMFFPLGGLLLYYFFGR